MSAVEVTTGLVCGLAFASFGGGWYEVSVVDPAWPKRPDIIQPRAGGISRRRFWIPAHVTFELMLLAALVASWSVADVRTALIIAVVSHGAMRLWSAFDFIPKALVFEKSETTAITVEQATRWTHRSFCRLPLDLVTCGAAMAAFGLACAHA
ncbi:hypothetical protein J8I29_03340 [Labrys sp. LIt4]|uniref:hypothetical protein n=1 Tax=Labrys sp. LIt4 TaxID=2821355 RepID=UPI001ADFCAC6|nr:hypothetical protein [Labrys sp. LIt4]MBP0578333.1 hypothetical protein [Labrys sp. LIt4]